MIRNEIMNKINIIERRVRLTPIYRTPFESLDSV